MRSTFSDSEVSATTKEFILLPKLFKSMKKNSLKGHFMLFYQPNKLLQIMRLSLMLIFISTLSLSAKISYSQETKISLRLENATLRDILKEIGKKTEFSFWYMNIDLKDEQKVSLSMKDQSINKILDIAFQNQNLTYEIKDKVILIYKSSGYTPEALQQNKITGTVTDMSNGEPIIGANVTVEGTTIGTVTDMDGKYTIEVPSKQSFLIFSYIGYLTEKIAVGDQVDIDIKLVPDIKNLEEVVVVGYGTQKKINLSGSVSQISSKLLENRSVSSVGQGLQGLIPNLNITVASGQSNTAPSFNVRGFNSINGGVPLILVDNVPVSAAELSRFNPNDIESISVLKDAASSSIYGGRAAYGVVLVKTKKGASDKLKVSVNSFYTSRSLGRVPQIETDPYNVAIFKHEMAVPWYNLYPDEAKAYAKQVSEGNASPIRINPLNPNKYEYFGSTNWFDEAYAKYSPSYSTNFNVSQRTDKVNYYLSGEYFNQEGMMKYGNDIYDRYNLRSKVELQATSWLKISNNTAYSNTKYDEPMYGGYSYFHQINRSPSLDIPRNENGTWTSRGAEMLGRLQEGGRTTTHNSTFNTSLGFDMEIIKNTLNIRGDANFVRTGINDNSWDGPITYYDGPNSTGLAGSTTTYAYQQNEQSRYNVYNLVADFHKTFGNHFFQALGGFNQEEYYYNYWWAQAKNLISISVPGMNLATGDKSLSSSTSTWALRGAFFRFNYIFKERYIIESNGRYDGTSRFPKDDRFGFFPSFSASWVVSKENFFNQFNQNILNDAISQFKFRASYGTLGNQAVSDYEYIPTMSSGTASWILGSTKPTYVNSPGLVSASLTWEEVRQYNLGVDLDLFKGKISSSFDVYNRQTLGMLTKGETLPSVLGTAVPKENAADLATKGWDLSLEWKDRFNIVGKSFNYSARLILSDNQSEITRFSNPTNSLSDYYVGRKIGEIWGFRTDGFFIDAADVEKYGPSHNNVASYIGTRPMAPGDIKFKNLNNDETISKGKNTLDDRGDQVILGNTTSRYPFSVDLSADWNGIDFRMFLQGIGKRDYFPSSDNQYFWGVYSQPWANVLKSNMDHWTPENPNAYFPRPKAYVAESGSYEVAIPNDRYIQNAAYCRVKNITLGYTFPKSWTQKVKIDRFRIYVSGENLLEFTKLDRNLDPEGLTGKIYPFQRIYSCGINLNF